MPKSHKPLTILVIAPAWVGDMVMAQTLFKFLKACHDEITIDVLAPSWTLPLAQRMPEVRSSILLPFGHGELKLFSRFLFARTLRAQGYDQVIVLPGSFKSALLAFWAKIPIRTGWLGEWRVGILNDIRFKKSHLPLMIQQFTALGLVRGQPLPSKLDAYFPALRIDVKRREELVKQHQLKSQTKILAICPGAEYGSAKRWPCGHFVSVANHMLGQGWQVWIFGSNKDDELAAQIQAGTNNGCINLVGKTSLIDAVDLLSLAQGVICNDSGLMHIVAALNNIPAIALYGSSSPDFTPPLAKNVSIIHLNLDCSPCFKRSCPLGHFNCMNNITPAKVLSEFNRLTAT